MSTREVHVSTHQGPWNESTRANPSLAFLEAYTNNVKSCDFTGAHHGWYAQSAKFYNTDSKIYDSGDAIWEWMKSLFGPFESIGEDEQRIARVLKDAAIVRPGVGVLDDSGLQMPKLELKAGDKKADLVFYEHVIIFYLRDLPGEGIAIKRMMEWVIADSEVEGQGWNGKQVWQGKVWWDRSILAQEIAGRRAAQGSRS